MDDKYVYVWILMEATVAYFKILGHTVNTDMKTLSHNNCQAG